MAKDLLAKHCRDVVDKTWNFSGKVKTYEDDVLNAVLGLGGEAGEVVDLHKKMFYHTEKAGRRLELFEELGDVFYYLAKILDLYDFDLQEILDHNKEKLFKRHNIKE